MLFLIMSDPRQERLAEFVAWTRAHVTGDEKGQAQIFLDHLFRAFGQKGSLDVGGSTFAVVRRCWTQLAIDSASSVARK